MLTNIFNDIGGIDASSVVNIKLVELPLRPGQTGKADGASWIYDGSVLTVIQENNVLTHTIEKLELAIDPLHAPTRIDWHEFSRASLKPENEISAVGCDPALG